ncbi:ferric reductase [Cellulophaga baltica]|uniref:ferric reductase-like transmembrane domain-containing protein n=1 Tax=Cellulophaga baltica TaxID=76594 RepID=UPI002148D2FE|nr:ferric reductase-like transmembrane domain-containing protein [Cellulophaga baltica]MCR1026676.1 ferric reductase [Cellulophaga baltica]
MRLIKKNYGWFIVSVLAILPLFILANFLEVEYASGFAVSLKESAENSDQSTIELLYHISGEFAIRWMTAVLSCTPFFILFGVTNLCVRQAMGIATAIWSIIHFIIFCAAEGFLETFTQVNYMAGFLAVLLLVPLLVTSNRKAMRRLKSKWKKLQSLAYIIILLSILHVAILDKTWIIYAIIVGLGFILRIPLIKASIIAFRKRRLE